LAVFGVCVAAFVKERFASETLDIVVGKISRHQSEARVGEVIVSIIEAELATNDTSLEACENVKLSMYVTVSMLNCL
jgi:hypothetical protein